MIDDAKILKIIKTKFFYNLRSHPPPPAGGRGARGEGGKGGQGQRRARTRSMACARGRAAEGSAPRAKTKRSGSTHAKHGMCAGAGGRHGKHWEQKKTDSQTHPHGGGKPP